MKKGKAIIISLLLVTLFVFSINFVNEPKLIGDFKVSGEKRDPFDPGDGTLPMPFISQKPVENI